MTRPPDWGSHPGAYPAPGDATAAAGLGPSESVGGRPFGGLWRRGGACTSRQLPLVPAEVDAGEAQRRRSPPRGRPRGPAWNQATLARGPTGPPPSRSSTGSGREANPPSAQAICPLARQHRPPVGRDQVGVGRGRERVHHLAGSPRCSAGPIASSRSCSSSAAALARGGIGSRWSKYSGGVRSTLQADREQGRAEARRCQADQFDSPRFRWDVGATKMDPAGRAVKGRSPVPRAPGRISLTSRRRFYIVQRILEQ